MERIYLLEEGAYLTRKGEALVVMKGTEKLDEIPAADLKRLVLVGRASMTGPVLDFLISNRVDTVFLTPTGRFRASILLDDPGHVRLRVRQYRLMQDGIFQVNTARLIVVRKLENQQRLLLKRAGSLPTKQEIREASLKIEALKRRLLDKEDLDIEFVRGTEGAASRIFYSVFGLLIKNRAFTFTGRNKRPPLDPVNALLSFVYTLFTNEVMSAVKARGLDPYLGALHTPHHGTPALVCDLVEEWRSTAESFVLTIINRRHVTIDDFIYSRRPESPVLMTPKFMKALIRSYEKFVGGKGKGRRSTASIRWEIHRRVRSFVNYLEDPKIGF